MTNNAKIGLIVSITAITILVAVIFKIAKGRKSGFYSNKPSVMSNTTHDLSNGIIVSIPDSNFSKNNLVILWGGISYANPKWMYSQIPKEILYKYVFVIAPHNVNLSKVDSAYKPFLSEKKVNIDSVSILGFSAGALQVQSSYSKEYAMVGLIDPSTRNSFLNLDYSENTKMVYNERNWTSIASIYTLLPKLAKKISDKGGDSEKVSLSHRDIPKYFFDKFLK